MNNDLRNELLPYVTATLTGLLAMSPDDPLKQATYNHLEQKNAALARLAWDIAIAVYQEGNQRP